MPGGRDTGYAQYSVFLYKNEENRPFKVNINNPPGIPIWYQEPEYGSLRKDHNKTR